MEGCTFGRAWREIEEWRGIKGGRVCVCKGWELGWRGGGKGGRV